MLSAGHSICHLLQRSHRQLCTGSLPAVWWPQGSAVSQPYRQGEQDSLPSPMVRRGKKASPHLLQQAAPVLFLFPMWKPAYHKLQFPLLIAAAPPIHGQLGPTNSSQGDSWQPSFTCKHLVRSVRTDPLCVAELQHLLGIWTSSWGRSVFLGRATRSRLTVRWSWCWALAFFTSHQSSKNKEYFHLFL